MTKRPLQPLPGQLPGRGETNNDFNAGPRRLRFNIGRPALLKSAHLTNWFLNEHDSQAGRVRFYGQPMVITMAGGTMVRPGIERLTATTTSDELAEVIHAHDPDADPDQVGILSTRIPAFTITEIYMEHIPAKKYRDQVSAERHRLRAVVTGPHQSIVMAERLLLEHALGIAAKPAVAEGTGEPVSVDKTLRMSLGTMLDRETTAQSRQAAVNVLRNTLVNSEFALGRTGLRQ